MSEADGLPGWYAEARRRALASARRPRSAGSTGSTGSTGSREWPAFAPPVGLSDGPLGAVQAADREIARQTALRAKAVAEFAASRPASADRPQGERGAMSPERWAARPELLREVSEWTAPELSVACSMSQQAAETLLERSLTLVHRLPGTLAALEAGALHPGHLHPLLDKVAPVADDRIRAEVEALLLRWAAGRVTTPSQLGDKARREVLRRDARAAARRLARALKERGVSLRDEPVDGMAGLVISGTVPEVRALHAALGRYADALPDDERTRGQKMLDCLSDLVLRPGEHDLPPVQVLLTMVASVGTVLGGDAPGEIDGQVVPAEVIRAFLLALGPTPPEPQNAGSRAEAELPWQEVEQRERERVSDELSRRILAGEFDGLPGWPDEAGDDEARDGAGALADAADACLRDPDRPPPVEEVAGDGEADSGSAGSGPPNEGPPNDGPPDARPRSAGPTGGRWWAEADRAVAHAGLALRDAEKALGHARRVVATARRADAADEAAWQESSAGRVTSAPDALAQLAAATEEQRDLLAGLLDSTGGGGLAERPRLALTDALTGALLGLADLVTLRRVGSCGRRACRRSAQTCTHDLTGRPGLAPPAATDGYRPGAALDRFVRARDRRCRFPGCRRRVPKGGELDHNRRYPDGPTAASNLAGYCTADHRGKHQAPGWQHDLAADGTLTVTTPTGLVAVTTPPPY